MKIKEMRTLPDDEVVAEIEKAKAKIFKVRFQGKGDTGENSGSVKALRHDVARLKTVLKEREQSRKKALEASGAKEGSE